MLVILTDRNGKEVFQFPPEWDGAEPDYIVFKGVVYEETLGSRFSKNRRYSEALWQNVVYVYQPEE